MPPERGLRPPSGAGSFDVSPEVGKVVFLHQAKCVSVTVAQEEAIWRELRVPQALARLKHGYPRFKCLGLCEESGPKLGTPRKTNWNITMNTLYTVFYFIQTMSLEHAAFFLQSRSPTMSNHVQPRVVLCI